MGNIFESTEINGLVLKNRLVRSATWEGMCDHEGRPTPKLAACYRDLAQGGVGLIITGYTFVSPEGKQAPGKMGIHTDDFAEDMKNLTATVHEAGGKICMQLVHAGGQTSSDIAGRQPLAPSAVEVDQYTEQPAEMSPQDIDEIVAAFGDGARRAMEYGFDAVQLHGAHGYLISQFLSPLTNRRMDKYGGNGENRCRFLMEVYACVRETVGPDYPVMIKLNCNDFIEGGLETSDAVLAAKLLGREGIDAIEVSGGTPASGEQRPARMKIKAPSQEAYHLSYASQIKDVVNCPIMVVGGFRSIEIIEAALGEEKADYISMARPFIREPGLANRWQGGDREPARCVSCNACFRPGLKEGGIYCVKEKKLREKNKYKKYKNT
jgi:2,4-dienoyl-CoA reductase-like NADH-dependent reductase (Old Yellow Enzyme family)